MSKGFGNRQHAIMAALASHECFWLRSMLDSSCTKAEYNSLLRAAMKLEMAGLIKIDRFMCSACQQYLGRTAIRRIGTAIPNRDDVEVISDGQVHPGNLTNT